MSAVGARRADRRRPPAGAPARAFGGTWSPARAAELLAAAGSKKNDLDAWLRDEFFKAHCQLFKNRPFIWHIWDGRKDGFSALVNYHRLDRPTLEKLTYTYLGDWIERQAAGRARGRRRRRGAPVAARELQRKLELILDGRAALRHLRALEAARRAADRLGRPTSTTACGSTSARSCEAGVLRAKFNVKWDKDRGKNPDGSERHNDLHLTIAEKQAARERAGA